MLVQLDKVFGSDVYVVETKRLEDLDVPLKMARLKQWCEDINAVQSDVRYDYVFVDEETFTKSRPSSSSAVAETFTEHK